jgi:hypothetical protein
MEWKPLNVITFGLSQTDNIKQVITIIIIITISSYFYLVTYFKSDLPNVFTVSG